MTIEFIHTALSRPLSEEEDDGDYSPDEDDVKKVNRNQFSNEPWES